MGLLSRLGWCVVAVVSGVTVADVAAALGRPAPALGSTDEQQWRLWISDAELLLSLGVKQRGWDPATLDAGVVAYVVRQAVVSMARRPDDSTEVQVSVDDASTTRRYSSSSGRVTILDEWWDLLDPGVGSVGVSADAAFGLDLFGARVGGNHADVCDITWGWPCSCGAYLTGGEYPLWEGGVLSARW